MAETDQNKLDPATVARLYLDYGDQLVRYLIGVLGDHQLARDVAQTTFARLVEQGHQTKSESRKAWLFRVAHNEAMAVRRRQAVGDRAVKKLAQTRASHNGSADEPLIRIESVNAVRLAIDQLPANQRQIVQMRIYEEKTFAVIAEELGIPLGTALGRMRAAVAKLREALDESHPKS